MKDMPVLTVEHLSAGYEGETAIADISFSLRAGEILCLVGESGCGKSTLLRALHGTDSGLQVFSGEIVLEGKALSGLPERESRRLRTERIGYIFQNPGAAFNPIRSYRKQFAETLKSHGKYDASVFEDAVAEAFGRLGLKDAKRILKSCPYEMSGGMNQRIALALSLLLEQEILFADEPVSALDATIQRRVADELRRLRDEAGIAQIIVTHNLALARYLADRISVMYAGRLVELGESAEVIARPMHGYTECLLRAVPALDGKMPAGVPGQPPPCDAGGKGCAFRGRCPRAKEICAAAGPGLTEIAAGHFTSCILPGGGRE